MASPSTRTRTLTRTRITGDHDRIGVRISTSTRGVRISCEISMLVLVSYSCEIFLWYTMDVRSTRTRMLVCIRNRVFVWIERTILVLDYQCSYGCSTSTSTLIFRSTSMYHDGFACTSTCTRITGDHDGIGARISTSTCAKTMIASGMDVCTRCSTSTYEYEYSYSSEYESVQYHVFVWIEITIRDGCLRRAIKVYSMYTVGDE